MDTIEPMVSPGPEATEPPTPPARPWLRRLGIVLLVVIALVVASTYVRLPYFAISPGSATPSGDYIVAPKDKSFPPKGHILLLTVSFREVTPIDFVVGSFDGDTLMISRKEANSGLPKGQNLTQFNRQLMDDSEQAAVVVAERRLGYPVSETGDGAFIRAVTKGGPSINILHPGDTITSVGGLPVHTLEQATTAIHAHRSGEVVPVTIHPAKGPDRTDHVTLGHRTTTKDGPTCDPTASTPAAGEDPCLGVSIETRNQNFQVPVKVRIDAGNIGGPSAGLSFTLGVIDQLTPGELTGGQKVAVTGTIDLEGNVGPVGGVKQKTAAAIAAGARYMLVPPDEYDEALARAKGHHLTVLKVTTLDEALSILGRLGGDVSVVTPPPGSGR